ncbi:Alpha/Beta hydrolase protein [Xylariomycetidae sp. FL0641]|nr:Alpha/Beta hydrolase protein [Xylariomycetidae sp. FL0641]
MSSEVPVPLAAVALPPSIRFESIRLDTKPTAALECTQVASVGEGGCSDVLVVFLNGLVAPQNAWLPVMATIIRRLEKKQQQQQQQPPNNNNNRPQMLAYDRFGQGKSVDRDPADAAAGRDPGYGHDVRDVVRDLHQLVRQVTQVTAAAAAAGEEEEQEQEQEEPRRRLLFVANSIGCAVARLYAQAYPGSVAGALLLDSILANRDFVGIFPDPDAAAAGFDADALPPGVTPDMLRETRAKVARAFHPAVRNPEGLDRRDLAALLPDADGPPLPRTRTRGGRDRDPLVTVVGHDPDWFAQESWEGPLAIPLPTTVHYTNPVWHRYNEGLVRLTAPAAAKGPVIAPKCGHFVQRDDPALVAELTCELLERLAAEA